MKNTFVFLPVFFAGKVLQWELLVESFLAFVIFSLTASAIYIINDYSDIASDRMHPEKKNRPLASGAISKRTAKLLLLALLLSLIHI